MSSQERALLLRVSPDRQRGLLWIVALLSGVAVVALQSVLEWSRIQRSIAQDPEPMGALARGDAFMGGSGLPAWWIPAALAMLLLAAVLTALCVRSGWAALPLVVTGALCGWAYLGPRSLSITVQEWAGTATWVAMAAAVACSPLVQGPSRRTRITAACLAVALPLSLWLGRVTSWMNSETLGVVDVQGLRIDPSLFLSEHQGYYAFYAWARLLETAAVAAAVAVVLDRSKLTPRWAAATVGVTAFAVTTSDLWAQLVGDGYDLVTDESYLWMDPRAILPVPVVIMIAATVQLCIGHMAGRPLRRLVPPVTPPALREALRHGLNDPGLDVLYWAPATSRYVDVNGLPAAETERGSDRYTTILKTRGSSDPLALVSSGKDPDQSQVTTNLLRAATRSLAETREQAVARAHAAELEASRHRMAETALRDRRRLEQDLHDGAQQRLLALTTRLALIRATVDPRTQADVDAALSELREALAELRDLARGVHPAILSQKGLRAAVESIAERIPLPVDITIPDRRLPPMIDSTVYFVICEALTNTVKHSAATRAAVTVDVHAQHLAVTIQDNGRGGATAGEGSGLRNLLDRVNAVGGSITITSPLRAGTTITGTLPCPSPTPPTTHSPAPPKPPDDLPGHGVQHDQVPTTSEAP